MSAEKLKQYIALFGGWLSAVLFFLGTIGIAFDWFTLDSIDAFVAVLVAFIPFALLLFGVWKNSYVISDKAKGQEEVLKRQGWK